MRIDCAYITCIRITRLFSTSLVNQIIHTAMCRKEKVSCETRVTQQTNLLVHFFASVSFGTFPRLHRRWERMWESPDKWTKLGKIVDLLDLHLLFDHLVSLTPLGHSEVKRKEQNNWKWSISNLSFFKCWRWIYFFLNIILLDAKFDDKMRKVICIVPSPSSSFTYRQKKIKQL